MRFQPIKKTLYTLNIGDYAPEIRALTFPLLRGWADKIGADFHVIEERKFPDWPIVYEKLQIYELGQGNDWNIFADADTLVHPEMFDVTEHAVRFAFSSDLFEGKGTDDESWGLDNVCVRISDAGRR